MGGFKQLDGETWTECVSHLPCSWQTSGACLNHNISVRSVTGKRCEVVIYGLDQVFDIIPRIRVMSSLKRNWNPRLVMGFHRTC